MDVLLLKVPEAAAQLGISPGQRPSRPPLLLEGLQDDPEQVLERDTERKAGQHEAGDAGDAMHSRIHAAPD
jgi:hypothetical protein